MDNKRISGKTFFLLLVLSFVIVPNIPFSNPTHTVVGSSLSSHTMAAPGGSSAVSPPTTFVRVYPSNGISNLKKTSGIVPFYVVVNNTTPYNAFLVSIRYSKPNGVLKALKYTGPGTGSVDAKNNMLGPLEGTTNCPSNAPETCAKLFRYCVD